MHALFMQIVTLALDSYFPSVGRARCAKNLDTNELVVVRIPSAQVRPESKGPGAYRILATESRRPLRLFDNWGLTDGARDA